MVAVHRYEGTVNQVMGDGIMALFGAPIAHEDHAVWSCDADSRCRRPFAATVRDAPQAWARGADSRRPNAGEVVVRAIGNDLHMEYSAIGQRRTWRPAWNSSRPPGLFGLRPRPCGSWRAWYRSRLWDSWPLRG